MPEALLLPFEATFQTVSDRLQASLGHTLFTVSRNLPGGAEVQRIYTSLPQDYPNGGRKPADAQSDWGRTIASGQAFVASRPADFGPHFQDLDSIVALGFGAVVNVGVFDGPRLLGTLNLLDKQGAYGAGKEHVQQACDAVHALARRAFLEYEQQIALST
jgi:hypothetical protein